MPPEGGTGNPEGFPVPLKKWLLFDLGCPGQIVVGATVLKHAGLVGAINIQAPSIGGGKDWVASIGGDRPPWGAAPDQVGGVGVVDDDVVGFLSPGAGRESVLLNGENQLINRDFSIQVLLDGKTDLLALTFGHDAIVVGGSPNQARVAGGANTAGVGRLGGGCLGGRRRFRGRQRGGGRRQRGGGRRQRGGGGLSRLHYDNDASAGINLHVGGDVVFNDDHLGGGRLASSQGQDEHEQNEQDFFHFSLLAKIALARWRFGERKLRPDPGGVLGCLLKTGSNTILGTNSDAQNGIATKN